LRLPWGGRAITELTKWTESLEKFYMNLMDWTRVIEQPGFNITQRSDEKVYRNYQKINRQLGKEIDKHYSKAMKIINRKLGNEL